MQYNWKYRIYKNGSKESECFDDLVGDRVAVRIFKDMYYPIHWPLTSRDIPTPFQGISIKPYQDSPEFADFLSTFIHAKSRPWRIWSEFKKAICEGWMENKIHVIGASSGYDSRLIAKALYELRHEKGKSWFGETYFVECGGEYTGFKQVMIAIGWTKENYIIWKPNYDAEYFKDIHERFNGLCAYPVNQWYDFYVQNWNLEDIQYISGYGGNVSDAMRSLALFLQPIKNNMTVRQRLQLFFNWNYNYQLAAFKQPKYSFHPFWSWTYIKAIAGFEHKEKKTSMYLCKHFVPECSHIPRMTILGDVTDAGHRTVRAKELDKMYWEFKKTRYGKRNKIKPNPIIEYNRWWLEYCIASYVEKNNINVR